MATSINGGELANCTIAMARQEVRLISGVFALVAIYAAGNVFYQSSKDDASPLNTPQQALLNKGQRLIDNCTACHYLDQRANFVGPHLVGIASRPIASDPDFAYSPAIKKLQGSWTPERLVAFLTAPQKYAPGTKMAVQGWSIDEARAIAAYLESRD